MWVWDGVYVDVGWGVLVWGDVQIVCADDVWSGVCRGRSGVCGCGMRCVGVGWVCVSVGV